MPTRDICILPQELPYQQRAFEHNLGGRAIPQMFCGGTEGYTRQVHIETGLRQQSTRDPDGCVVYEFRDYGNMQPLPCEWQRPDMRPLHFTQNTRNDIKDIGRAPEAVYDQARQCATVGGPGMTTYTPYFDRDGHANPQPPCQIQPSAPIGSARICAPGWIGKSVPI